MKIINPCTPNASLSIQELLRINNVYSEIGDTLDLALNKIITCDESMILLKERVRILAKYKDPVLITGPSGTGKELIARAISAGHGGPFISVNMAGLPDTLIESILFGHKKGTFTGALMDSEGLFMAAKEGCIFLDEIGELPLNQQGKLLRVLDEDCEVLPLGSSEVKNASCRVICASNRNLEEMIEEGKFKEDLYWRISTITLKTTALLERRQDIELIAQELGWRREVHGNIPDTALKGNVRSLKAWVRNRLIFRELERKGQE